MDSGERSFEFISNVGTFIPTDKTHTKDVK